MARRLFGFWIASATKRRKPSAPPSKTLWLWSVKVPPRSPVGVLPCPGVRGSYTV